MGQLETGQAVPEPRVWCHWGKAGSSERGEVRGMQEGGVSEREVGGGLQGEKGMMKREKEGEMNEQGAAKGWGDS